MNLHIPSTEVIVTNSDQVTAEVILKDNESGVNVTASKWEYNTNSGYIGTTESSYSNTFSENEQRIKLRVTEAGTYYLHVLVIDNAGNKKEIVHPQGVVVKKELVADGSYNDEKGVNTPNIGEGMTPIKWNGSSWVNTTGSDPEWYDYTAKKWANAKTSDGSMWVWIPRYAYSIPSAGYHKSTATEINIEFMKGTRNESSTGRTSFQNASGAGNWNIHPAFNYGQEVSGIWVAKFEASNSSGKIKVVPGVSSWRDITVNDIYTNCLNYNKTLNSHMMKNYEWGAVAYLSKSKYGKENEEVWINNSSSYITGSAGNSASASIYAGTTNDYTSTQGVKASTTGTVHGVYDMSGGAWEYVASYVNNGDGNLTEYGASLVNGDTKTKNVYNVYSTGSQDNGTNNYNANSGVYGDAVYETSTSDSSSWHGDYSSFPNGNLSFFGRGGDCYDDTRAGVFSFYNYFGGSVGNISFRPVLVIL